MNTENNTNPARRQHERVPVEMPVSLAEGTGTTRDVSASGVYFEFDGSMAVGSDISFEIEMTTPQGPMKLKCRGQVVRTEQNGSRMGVAVKMNDSRLEAV
jgi:hypothetical protein